MKSHETKESTRPGAGPIEQRNSEDTHTGAACCEGVAAGGGTEKKVGKIGKWHRVPAFKGGEVIGRLTVISLAGLKNLRQYWKCSCECGKETEIRTDALSSGRTKSCGCLISESSSKRFKTHGETGKHRTTEYTTWYSLIARCNNKNRQEYPSYGGRGITVCDRWLKSFEAFLEDMGRKPSRKHTIERTDNDGNYEPLNCRWATRKEQVCNRRNNKNLTHEGRTENINAWAEITGINKATLAGRLKSGWSIEKALTTPTNKKYRIKC